MMGCLRAAALSQLREGIFIPPRSVDDKLDDLLKVKHSERLLHHCVMSVLEICGFAVKRSEKKQKNTEDISEETQLPLYGRGSTD